MSTRNEPLEDRQPERQEQSHTPRWVWWLLAAIIGSGALLRILFWMKFPVIATDGVGYCYNARNIFTGGNLSLIHYPFYSVPVGLFWLVLGDLQFCARLVSFVSGIALIPLVYLLGRRLFDWRVGIVSAGIIAFLPQLVWYSTQEMTESFYAFMYLASIHIFLSAWQRQKWGLFVLFAGVAGLTFLTRAEGLGLLGISLCVLLLVKHPGAQYSLRQRVLRSVLILIVFCAVCSPYWVWLSGQTGDVSATGKAVSLGQCTPETRLTMVAEKGGPPPPKGFLLERLPEISAAYLTNAEEVFFHRLRVALPLNILVFFPLGLGICLYYKKRRTSRLIAAAMIAPPFIVIPVLHFFSRYFLPYMTVVTVFSSAGILFFARALRDRLSTDLAGRLSVYIVFVACSLPLFYRNIGNYTSDPILPWHQQCIESGKWIANNLPGEHTIMSRKTQTAWYAGAEHTGLAWAPGELAEMAARRGADIIVLERELTNAKRPLLKRFLEAGSPDGLAVIHRENDFTVFRVKLESRTED